MKRGGYGGSECKALLFYLETEVRTGRDSKFWLLKPSWIDEQGVRGLETMHLRTLLPQP